MQYHLPPYEKCPIHFLREVLAGDKMVSLTILYWKVLKKESVVYLDVPRYKELSVHNIWSLVYEVPDLAQYFPTLQPNRTPDRNYMFAILATLRNEKTKNMIQNARKNRSPNAPEEVNNMIFINKNIYEEIMGVASQKRKYYCVL